MDSIKVILSNSMKIITSFSRFSSLVEDYFLRLAVSSLLIVFIVRELLKKGNCFLFLRFPTRHYETRFSNSASQISAKFLSALNNEECSEHTLLLNKYSLRVQAEKYDEKVDKGPGLKL